MKPYPILPRDPQLEDVFDVLGFINRERLNDVQDFNNIQNRFVAGRKVGKVPSSSADVVGTDKLGDLNYDASYLYILIDNAGTAEWRRASLGSW